MDPLLDFSGKVALVTGAANGFGKLIAKALAERGAKLVIGDINDVGINAVASELQSEGADVIAMTCNVADENQCKAMVDSAVSHFGQLDIAINNAGVAHDFVAMHEIDEKLMDFQFGVNVKGVQFGMKYQLGQMIQQAGGCILNVSSMAGLGGAMRLAPYSMAKHAVIGLTKTAAVEYGRNNIRVNAVCPFFTLTNMVTDVADDEMQAVMSQGSPMKRLGQPEEIVSMMLMMISPANSYLSGQCIAVDGAVSAS